AHILTLKNAATSDAAFYSVIVSNAFGTAESEDAILEIVVSPPHITMQPTNRSLAPGGTAIFSVTAEGNLPLFYHWRKDGTNLNDGVNTSGTATPTLTLSGVTEANNGTYA